MFEKCKGCKSYNNGKGTKKCLRCGSYTKWSQDNELSNDIHFEVLPDGMLANIGNSKTLDILNILKQLPVEQSAIVSMYYFGGLTTREIAEVMHSSKTEISRQIKAGIGTIKKNLSI